MDTPGLLAQFEAIRAPKKRAYLVALSHDGVVRRACALAEIHESTPWVWRQDDPEFVRLEEAARRVGTEAAEAEVYRRAVTGVERPVYYQGKRVDTITEYSDPLLMFWLKAQAPEKYRERMELSGDRTRPLTVQIVQEAD